MSRPIILDLFCSEGAGARGYIAAGWDVIGGDLRKSVRRYYPGPFVLGDWSTILDRYAPLVDAVHASPPCQRYSVATPLAKKADHPDLIDPVREALIATGLPYVIENVTGARYELQNALMLCGSMFDLEATDLDGTRLRLERHRYFESNVLLFPPGPDRHDKSIPVGGVYGGGSQDRARARDTRHGGYTPSKSVQARLIGVPASAMTQHGLTQAIPPAYTQHIGTLLLDYLTAGKVA